MLTRYLLHLSYDITMDVAFPFRGLVLVIWFMPCAARHIIHSCLWCDFVSVSSGLPPPFLSSAFCRSCCLCWLGYASFFVAYCLFFLVPSTIVLQHVIVPSTDSPAFTRLLTAVPTVRCLLTSSLVICSRWCRIRTCDVSHIPDTCVPAFVHSANHLPFIPLSALAGHHRVPCAVASSSDSTTLSGVLCPEHLSLLHTHEAMSVRISSTTPS